MSFVKDPVEREKQLSIVRGWQEEVERLAALLNKSEHHYWREFRNAIRMDARYLYPYF
jgi:hypothetical protein